MTNRSVQHRSVTHCSKLAPSPAPLARAPPQVPAAVRMARAAVASGKCAVIGLQSTGEARTAGAVADRGEELDDFVSGACGAGLVGVQP